MAEDREGRRRTARANRVVSLGGLAGLELTPGPGTTGVCQMGASPATPQKAQRWEQHPDPGSAGARVGAQSPEKGASRES